LQSRGPYGSLCFWVKYPVTKGVVLTHPLGLGLLSLIKSVREASSSDDELHFTHNFLCSSCVVIITFFESEKILLVPIQGPNGNILQFVGNEKAVNRNVLTHKRSR
jgi:hypothetical protein